MIRTAFPKNLKTASINRIETMAGSEHISTPANDSATAVVGIAASAGGFNALKTVLLELPADLLAAVLIVQHIAPQYPSHLAELLTPFSTLHIKQAVERDTLSKGTIYIAPPDKHLVVNVDKLLHLTRAEKVLYVRPSANVLFNSIAETFGDHAIGIVLTGMGSDGANGVKAIKSMGGKVIVQDQATSAFFSMPNAAISTGSVDEILPLNDITAALVRLLSSFNNEV
jgi:two-component system, chemotaxis family, protein-glutamate methylesterase/glutaminase